MIKSCVFHYEAEFIHPFADGNGRMGRFWQTVLLTDWRPVFTWIPVETIVKKHQQEYYRVIGECDKTRDSSIFVEFMLRCLKEAVEAFGSLNMKCHAEKMVDILKNVGIESNKLGIDAENVGIENIILLYKELALQI